MIALHPDDSPSMADSSEPPHRPVLLTEVLVGLQPVAGGHIVDATFGRGGYSRALLESCDCRVTAIDRDPEAIAAGAAMVAHYPVRLRLHHARFSELGSVIQADSASLAVALPITGVVFDLGVSSPQLDQAERGFSFRLDGPLDMRMGAEGVSAAEFINTSPEEEIAAVLHHLGEERYSRRIAAAIVAARTEAPITRTGELAALIARVVPRPSRKPGGKAGQGREEIDPATRSFQALRIWVNDELRELQQGLAAASAILAPGGRLAVVSFHSLEDRIVKQFIAEHSQPKGSGVSRHLPIAPVGVANEAGTAEGRRLRNLTPRPIYPTAAEIASNPRSRSARLRIALALPKASRDQGSTEIGGDHVDLR
ncbi:MAG: 16S rRNA (cytosine(1402)-N(4))-methyltransferase RsmH [Alphaproteobacteria bacterium]|nr:16S rRNA (cytosine(1402)-N(4))-methyltransferase RsmH [Alphaproteobacteria bacterium]